MAKSSARPACWRTCRRIGCWPLFCATSGVCKEDAAVNDAALEEGGRILSAYPIDPTKPAKGYGANVFWIITEADRSMTTFLLPEEY